MYTVRPTVIRLPVDHFTASGSSVSLLVGLGQRGECILFLVVFNLSPSPLSAATAVFGSYLPSLYSYLSLYRWCELA